MFQVLREQTHFVTLVDVSDFVFNKELEHSVTEMFVVDFKAEMKRTVTGKVSIVTSFPIFFSFEERNLVFFRNLFVLWDILIDVLGSVFNQKLKHFVLTAFNCCMH